VNKALLLISIICLGTFSSAQEVVDSSYLDKTIPLGPIAIVAELQDANKSMVSQELQKANPVMALPSMLAKQSGVYVRSNGRSGLSTSSYKGLGSLQTPVTINGVNMQSPMNGTIDLTLINGFHFNTLSLGHQYNDQVGSSNMGNSIDLRSSIQEPTIDYNLGFNSLLGRTLGLKCSGEKERWRYGISVLADNSPNAIDLSIYGLDEKQENANYSRYSLLFQNDLRLKNNNQWNSTFYFVSGESGVPQTLVDRNQNRQQDVLRSLSNRYVHRITSTGLLELNNQIAFQNIRFDNKLVGVTESQAVSVNTTLRYWKNIWENWNTAIGLANENTIYNSDALETPTSWNRYRAFLQVNRRGRESQFDADLGGQLYSQTLHPNFRIQHASVYRQRLRLKTSVERVFRLPTLNELYWYEPGRAFGNSNIEPEQGYKADVIASYSRTRFSLSLNPHAGRYENWVEWRGFPIIRPVNVRNVSVIGTEIQGSYRISLGQASIISQVTYHWVRSRYAGLNWFESNNSQLIFTPEHTGNTTITYLASTFSAYINAQFIGKNYVTSDNSRFLEPFTQLEVGGSYQMKNWRFGTTISNILNQPYFTQPNSPMPGRLLTLNINYNIPLKKT